MKTRVSLLVRSGFVLASLFPVVACLIGACATSEPMSSTGAGGSAGSAPVSCGGSGGTSEKATWANVRDILAPQEPIGGCFGSDCHTQGDREPYLFGLESAPLSDADLYRKLTTYKTTLCGQRMLVKPCAPEESAFYLAQMGQCGDLAQMPFGCDPKYDNCTPADKLEGLRQWIAKGAPAP
jgi:hypothetical protein